MGTTRRRPAKRRQEATVKEAARWTRVNRAIGRSPDAHLRWLLDFSTRDLASASPDEWADISEAFSTILSHSPLRPATPPPLWIRGEDGTDRVHVDTAQLLAAQQELKGFFQAAAGVLPKFEPRSTAGAWYIHPEGSRELLRVVSGPIEAEGVEVAWDLMLRTRDGRRRIHACELQIEGHPCGVVFLAERRTKKYCTREHAARAAWGKYWEGQGRTRAKK